MGNFDSFKNRDRGEKSAKGIEAEESFAEEGGKGEKTSKPENYAYDKKNEFHSKQKDLLDLASRPFNSVAEIRAWRLEKDGPENLQKAFLRTNEQAKKIELFEQSSFDVDFGGVDKFEWGIGAADILPTHVWTIRVTAIDTDGTELWQKTGVRDIRPGPGGRDRVGYYDDYGYIPIFSNYKIEVVEMKNPNDTEVTKLAKRESDLINADLEYEKQLQAELETTLGTPELAELFMNPDEEAIKETALRLDNLGGKLKSLSGDQVWYLRQRLGPQGMKNLVQAAGLNYERINTADLVGQQSILTSQDDKILLQAVISIESAGQVFAVSDTGALGPLQLTRYIYYDISPPINPFDPQQAVGRAAEHLKDLISRHGKTGAIMAYYAGENAMGNQASQEYYGKHQKMEYRIRSKETK